MVTVISFVYVSVHEEAAWLTRFPTNLTIDKLHWINPVYNEVTNYFDLSWK